MSRPANAAMRRSDFLAVVVTFCLSAMYGIKADEAAAATPPVALPASKGKKVVGRDTKENLSVTDARRVLSEVEKQVKSGQNARINVSWIIEEGGGS